MRLYAVGAERKELVGKCQSPHSPAGPQNMKFWRRTNLIMIGSACLLF